MTRLRWISPLLCLLACAVLVVAWAWLGTQKDVEGYVGRQTGLKLPEADHWEYFDDHGGFLGDGKLLVMLCFSDEDGVLVEERIKSRGDLWNEGPFDDYLGGILYRNGRPAKEAGWPRSPQNAYWFFKDRHSQQEKALDERHSWNYTAALYDADTDTLYYLEYDT